MPPKHVLAFWLPPLLWLGFIFLASTDLFSADRTGTTLSAVLKWLLPDLDNLSIHYIHVYLRKAGHVIVYGVFSVLLFRALRDGRTEPAPARWSLRWAVLAIVLSVGAALADEFVQTTQQSRSGKINDVLLDTVGVVSAQIVIFLYWRGRRVGLREKAPASAET